MYVVYQKHNYILCGVVSDEKDESPSRVIFEPDFLCHVANENKPITIYQSAEDGEGWAPKTVLES